MFTSGIVITLIVILISIVLFAIEVISIDLVALSIIITLIITGVITPEQGIEGFSNKATITVAFMFILSAALLKTGSLQYLAHKLAKSFRYNFNLSIILMMILIAFISAFINNTPVVAVFIPIVIQIAHSAGHSPQKILIPLSFASIFGGTCTLIGTSTNILVSGIAESHGVGEISMFSMTPFGLILLVVGILYMIIVGIKLLPNRQHKNSSVELKYGIRDYLAEIQLLDNASSINKPISASALVTELGMDIIAVTRNGEYYPLPQDEFVLRANDVLKVKCEGSKIKELKDKGQVLSDNLLKIGGNKLKSKETSLVEIVVTSNSSLEGKTLRQTDFKRRFRAVPLAIQHREDIQHESLYDYKLKSGDLILFEVRTRYLDDLKKMEFEQESPIAILSEENLIHFDQRKFYIVLSVLLAVVITATLGIFDIMVAAILGVTLLCLLNVISMKEAYESIGWKVIMLLAGALALGTAMSNTGLDLLIADSLIAKLGSWGPVAILSGLYLITSVLTEFMSNHASAALLAPIAIVTAQTLGVNPMPFLMAVTFAASASFMTPMGYHANTMVYSAGQYRFMDFVKVGTLINILFWILATFLIPIIYPF